MTQAPFQIDALRIEPGAVGTRAVDRDSTGALRFTDPSNPSGITLSGLAGLRSVGSVLVVGKSGPGAQYNTIQDAVDAVPPTSSITAPTVILICAGVYSENVVIEKDGVWMLGLGGVILESPSATATITIQESITVIPLWVRMQNLRILNAYDGGICVHAIGGASSEVGTLELATYDCELVASGVGTYQVYAESVNFVRVQGGTFGGSSASSALRATNCHRVAVSSVERIFNVQLDYSTAGAIPNLVGSYYKVSESTLGGNILSTLSGAGSLELGSLVREGSVGDLTVNGDGVGTFTATSCRLGDVTINGNAPLALMNCSRGSAAGAGTLAEDTQEGSVGFAVSASESVVFGVAQPDASYSVHPETELTVAMGVVSKTSAGFTLEFAAPQTTTVIYKVLRRMS